MHFILLYMYMPETLCGPAILKGPLNKKGKSEPLLRVEANLPSEDPIVIKCQLNHTDPDVTYEYNLWLQIYFTSLNEEPYHRLTREDQTFESKFDIQRVGNIINYSVNISASARLERSIIACAADYQPVHGMPHQICYTESTAIIIFRDYDPCDHPTMAPLVATPITPPTNFSTTATPLITMSQEVFFPVVGIVILVGIILVVANGIQLWVIIIMKNRKTTKAVNVSATNGIALAQLSTEVYYEEHGTDSNLHGNELDQHGTESEDDSKTPNGMATESG